MNGIVKRINPGRGMVAVLTEEGSFSVFELLADDPIEVGDKVSWSSNTNLGGERITNRTQKRSFEVYFQNHYVNLSQLNSQLLF
jgi:hypothetical protein